MHDSVKGMSATEFFFFNKTKPELSSVFSVRLDLIRFSCLTICSLVSSGKTGDAFLSQSSFSFPASYELSDYTMTEL